MKIEAGKLDRKLEFVAVVMTKDDLGQEIATETVSGTAYAQRLQMRTQDAARAGGRETFAMCRYLIRWRPIDTTHRVRVDGKLYDIVAIDEEDRRASLILTMEERTR